MSQNIIEVKNLRVSFKQKRKPMLNIIRGVDLTIPKGTIIGLVGESGSGKSVTTKALLDVNYGAVTEFDFLHINDDEYTSYEEINFKKYRGPVISYIPQNPMTSMNPSRKIGKQILDVLNEYKKDLFKKSTEVGEDGKLLDPRSVKKKKLDYIIEVLNRFKIINPEMVLGFYPHELSGGMKQRIIIAMAVIAGSQVIVADEPTTALDTTVQSSVLELIQEVNQREKITVIFISHNIGVIAKLCDYIYVMYAGRVVEKATKEELFTNPRHPYTWALMAAIPEGKDKNSALYTIPGSPPDMSNLAPGDPFASRNRYAVAADFKQEPPLFEVSPTHYAATWMIHPSYPKFEVPEEVTRRIEEFKKTFKK